MSAPRQGAATGDIILAWKQLRHPLSLTLSITRNVWLPVPQSIITWMVLRTAVSHDGAATTEAVCWVKNNGQQLLTVALPKGGRILSDVQTGDAPQQPQQRAGSEGLLIKLSASTEDRQWQDPFSWSHNCQCSQGRKGLMPIVY